MTIQIQLKLLLTVITCIVLMICHVAVLVPVICFIVAFLIQRKESNVYAYLFNSFNLGCILTMYVFTIWYIAHFFYK